MRPWLAACAVAAAAVLGCGGSDKPAPPPAATAEPTPPEAPVEPAAATDPAVAAASCADLCAKIAECITELSGQTPTEEELTQLNTQCEAECGNSATEAAMVQAAECLSKPACSDVVQCLQEIQV